MSRRFRRCLSAALSLGCLLPVAQRSASAAIVFDDHFDGNSGGVPVGWYLLVGDAGSVVEAGTHVTLCGDVAILSDAYVDPSEGTVVLTIEVSATESEYGVGTGLLEPLTWNRFVCDLSAPDGQLEVGVADLDGGEEHYIAGYLAGYTGGAIRLTLVLEPTTFSISTDSPPFSSGPIAYAAVFSTFTREDLGPAVNVALANDVLESGTGCSSVDRITVDVDLPTPVAGTTFGRIKALFRR